MICRGATNFLTLNLTDPEIWRCERLTLSLVIPWMTENEIAPAQSPRANPERWVDEHGECLYRFALLRVRKPEIAEDLVHESLLAAVRTMENYSGRSTERSWLVAILKNKISDHFRKSDRETPFTDMQFLGDEMSHKFKDGFWNHDLGPKEWQESEAVTFRGEFWQTMRACLDKLPPRMADVFMMREMDGIDSLKICETLQISQSNLWVILHRARMALRECLEKNWFGKTDT